MTAGRARMLPDRSLAAPETALDLFFEIWRLSTGDEDPSRARRRRLGALRLLQRVTAIGLEESRPMARARLREARVELRRLVQAMERGGGGAEGQGASVCRGDELAASLGRELSRLSQALCTPEPLLGAEPPRTQAHDSRLTTHDTSLSD